MRTPAIDFQRFNFKRLFTSVRPYADYVGANRGKRPDDFNLYKYSRAKGEADSRLGLPPCYFPVQSFFKKYLKKHP
jgi:hypothetical protein